MYFLICIVSGCARFLSPRHNLRKVHIASHLRLGLRTAKYKVRIAKCKLRIANANFASPSANFTGTLTWLRRREVHDVIASYEGCAASQSYINSWGRISVAPLFFLSIPTFLSPHYLSTSKWKVPPLSFTINIPILCESHMLFIFIISFSCAYIHVYCRNMTRWQN